MTEPASSAPDTIAAPEPTPVEGAAPQPEDADELLLRFIRDRDIDCPRCGYNLRNLTKAICPECEERLTLKVALESFAFGWLFATVAPGFFCGIIAGIFLFLVLFGGAGGPPGFVWLIMLGFALSGVFAVVLCVNTRRFIRKPALTQATWAFVVWTIHLIAFAIFLRYT